MGHHLIMGRKTYESIGRPLPGRITVVFRARLRRRARRASGALARRSLRASRRAPRRRAVRVRRRRSLRQALALCDRCYLTVVERQYTGDAIFPGLGTDEWALVASEPPHGDDAPIRFETWDRRGTR